LAKRCNRQQQSALLFSTRFWTAVLTVKAVSSVLLPKQLTKTTSTLPPPPPSWSQMAARVSTAQPVRFMHLIQPSTDMELQNWSLQKKLILALSSFRHVFPMSLCSHCNSTLPSVHVFPMSHCSHCSSTLPSVHLFSSQLPPLLLHNNLFWGSQFSFNSISIHNGCTL
jgi:hypothetical protein